MNYTMYFFMYFTSPLSIKLEVIDYTLKTFGRFNNIRKSRIIMEYEISLHTGKSTFKTDIIEA